MNSPTSRTRLARRSVVTVVALGFVALSACGGDEAASGVTTVATVATTAPSVDDTTTTTTTPLATTTAPTTAPTTAAPTTAAPTTTAPATTVPGGADCLIGHWVAADDDLQAYFDEVATNGAWDSIENDGTMRFTFTGDTYTRTLDLTLTTVLDGTVYVGRHDISSTQKYTVVDGRPVPAGSLTFEGDSSFTKDGQPLTDDPGDLFVGVMPLADVDAFEHSCDGPTLTIGAGPDPDDTFDLPLTPA